MPTMANNLSLDASNNLQIAPALATVFRVNSGSVAPGQTLKTFTGRTQTANGSTTSIPLYTVSAGKTFFLTDLCLSSFGSVELDIQLQAAGVTILRSVCFNTSPISIVGLESQPSAGGGTAVTILLPSGGAGVPYVDWFVGGFEQ